VPFRAFVEERAA
jgi:sulfite reductase alpha subunit-like flavoprotein